MGKNRLEFTSWPDYAISSSDESASALSRKFCLFVKERFFPN